MPLSGAIPASNSEIAFSPPAEAPIPTTVNDGTGSSVSMALVVTFVPCDEVRSSYIRGLSSGDTEQKRRWHSNMIV
jgi:hypothetical protein